MKRTVALRQGPGRHGDFGAHLVSMASITPSTPAGKDSRPVIRLDKRVDTGYLAMWMDGGNALLHGINFGHPQGFAGCLDLAVHVGLGHVVHVDQGYAPDPGTG
jgi:hypothetical protein